MGLRKAFLAAAVTGFGILQAGASQARDICTVVADAASEAVLLERGDCARRVTPASTFKIPLAVMGFDAGFLTGAEEPVLTIRKGEPDWGGGAWRKPTGPREWMRHSVVWYSQRIAAAIGRERIERYATDFGYGNADLAGDPGQDNGLMRGWISSSLKISPREQTDFLRNVVNDALPAGSDAIARARSLLETNEAGGWQVRGKTGSAYPRKADGTFDRERGWGWYVGWAQKDGRILVFARLTQDEERAAGSTGIRTREAFLQQWPALAESLSR